MLWWCVPILVASDRLSQGKIYIGTAGNPWPALRRAGGDGTWTIRAECVEQDRVAPRSRCPLHSLHGQWSWTSERSLSNSPLVGPASPLSGGNHEFGVLVDGLSFQSAGEKTNTEGAGRGAGGIDDGSRDSL